MKIEIQLDKRPSTIIEDTKYFVFSGGEVHIELPQDDSYHTVKRIVITQRITNSDAIMELLMVTDALRRRYGSVVPICVTIPYLPYARQDKISASGESLSLKVFADLINSQKYDRVTCFDVHSDVSNALINNLHNISQSSVINYVMGSIPVAGLIKGKVLVTPDHGAAKKIYKSTEYIKPSHIIPADKARDTSGKIIKTEVYAEQLYGLDTVIIDDIADGGRTFIELAKVLKERGAQSVTLFVTHGIFSQGTNVLFDGGIDNIITTDTFAPIDYYITGVSKKPIIVTKVVDNLF